MKKVLGIIVLCLFGITSANKITANEILLNSEVRVSVTTSKNDAADCDCDKNCPCRKNGKCNCSKDKCICNKKCNCDKNCHCRKDGKCSCKNGKCQCKK